MTIRLQAILLLLVASTPVFSQGVLFFQDGVTELPSGDLYDGTLDTEFRAANPTEPQNELPNLSIDQFDGGFQTQAAIRFENILVSDGGLLPDELTADKITFAEFRLWKQSPSQSDANIDFNRILGPDTTSGAIWNEEDTWASLGGDLIPDAAGLLDGDPISRDDIEATSVPDFQDSPNRFDDGVAVVLDPSADPVPASMVYRVDQDSEDVFDEAWDGSEADLARAIDVAFWRFDVTEAIQSWFADSDPSTPGTQPSQENLGWAINNDTGDGWDMQSSDVSEFFESEFELLDTAQFRPSLTIIFDDGSAGPLDINKDAVIDLSDYDLFLDLLGSELDGPLATGAAGDFDFNRQVDLDDFKFFKANFPGGEAGLEAALAAAVPEPSSNVLFLFAFGVLALFRQKTRQQR